MYCAQVQVELHLPTSKTILFMYANDFSNPKFKSGLIDDLESHWGFAVETCTNFFIYIFQKSGFSIDSILKAFVSRLQTLYKIYRVWNAARCQSRILGMLRMTDDSICKWICI